MKIIAINDMNKMRYTKSGSILSLINKKNNADVDNKVEFQC